MTKAVTSNRMGLFAGLSGAASIICFGAFNHYQRMSELFLGAPFISLALGLTALVTGIMALRSRPKSQGVDWACAWFGIVCGCGMIVAWAGIAVLLVGAISGHPM